MNKGTRNLSSRRRGAGTQRKVRNAGFKKGFITSSRRLRRATRADRISRRAGRRCRRRRRYTGPDGVERGEEVAQLVRDGEGNLRSLEGSLASHRASRVAVQKRAQPGLNLVLILAIRRHVGTVRFAVQGLILLRFVEEDLRRERRAEAVGLEELGRDVVMVRRKLINPRPEATLDWVRAPDEGAAGAQRAVSLAFSSDCVRRREATHR